MESTQRQDLIREALGQPPAAVTYFISQKLTNLYPAKAIVEGEDVSFDLQAYAAAGHCTLERHPSVHGQLTTTWRGPREGLLDRWTNAWFDVCWGGLSIEVLLLSWTDRGQKLGYYWIMADTAETARRFLLAVCEWCAEVRGEIAVFEGGHWQKSQELFESIKHATFENLILRGSLKRQMQEELPQFFASRAIYEEYRIPWKRGILFLGPPGNGKTHAVKALVNSVQYPCLYVKSFRSESRTDHDNIQDVFQRARRTAPCLLIMEDLDSMVDDQNRSFFLNELDGFASNTGIVTLATTNHPERLDPAILHRPSRFDRKYTFDLPNSAERMLYASMWNEALEPALQLSAAAIPQLVEMTEGFSFAYLKELFVSSTMRWIVLPEPGVMDALVLAQAFALREQMVAAGSSTSHGEAGTLKSSEATTTRVSQRHSIRPRRR
jgi:hypothetical protein